MDYKKSNKIREIVRLQQILKKWRKIATSKPPTATTTTATTAANSGNKTIKYLKRTLSLSDHNNNVSSVPPKGYLAVSVGEDQKRFVIPMSYLSHRAFQFLLREAEEEFGFEQAGVLRFPCHVSVFESVVKVVEDKKNDVFFLPEIKVVAGGGYSCLSESQRSVKNYDHHSQHSPVCR